jgi:hypothetical protein
MVKDVDKAYVQEGKWAPAIGSLIKRAEVARQWLSERPETEIVVVTHGCFLHFLTDDWVNAVNPDGMLLPSCLGMSTNRNRYGLG